MAANKCIERLATLDLLMPLNVAIASGQPVLFGRGETDSVNAMAGVAAEAQTASNSTGPPYDNNSGYLTIDFEGAYNLTVVAETLGSVSAGAQINPGDVIYASGGTFDPVSGITYGFTLCADKTGSAFGRALAPVAAGTTAIIPVILKNSAT
jgi:hypothetical protein